ncbi:SYNJ [Acanthosepion pharaonis]|uniref:phosphoinositide 5-phosphatase n=1 Tax=Acanthosepion pharaonis TaxID=158019 RepID=A0A812CBL8_ACAPH|nr:SYNJ [Sepia pharaonis]
MMDVKTPDETSSIQRQYTKILDGYGSLGVLQFKSGDVVNLYLVMVTACVSVNKILDSEVFRVTATTFIPLQCHASDDEKVNEIRKLLNSGTFYFSWSSSKDAWDLSLCAQRQLQQHETDNRFFWNKMLHVHLERYGVDCSQWLFKVISGGVEIRTIYAGNKQAKACLISRLSCERAGTRFMVRGTNDDGHVANFVETEQVIFLDDQISSFLQVRGSVPLFWDQPGVQVGSHKIRLSRGFEACAPAFDRHMSMLKKFYGKQVIVNLLGSKEGEHMLSQAYQNHHNSSCHKDIPHIAFDYHAECRGGNLRNLAKLKKITIDYLNSFNFFHSSTGNITNQQLGTMRTNCVDCLDRTNAVQNMYGLIMLEKQMESLGFAGKPQMCSRFEEVYKQIWTENGDHVSRIYAGTGAMGGGRSKYSDAARSATRTIQNNFLDSNKQEAIDIFLLGSTLVGELRERAKALLTSRCLHAPEGILREMVARHREYTELGNIRICCGTWNVNGGTHFRSIAFKKEKLSDWLLDAHKCCQELFPNSLDADADYGIPPDIFAIGFEEIVDLNASNIVRASTENSREWQNEIQKTISREHKYIPLATVQLVGVCLNLFIRPSLAPFIRDVAIDSVKTGLGGATGNKGAVAIRFLFHATSFCFICAHFAADLHRDEVKELVRNHNWTALQAADQLSVQMKAGNVFRGFEEGQTNFAPTYKYDNFSDDYDTSEKCRSPAWTDRVLWRKRKFLTKTGVDDPYYVPVKQILYSRVELRTSDHRPVIALFELDYQKVNEEKKKKVLEDVVIEQGPPDATVIISLENGQTFNEALVDEIVQVFSECGEILLIRFVEEDMWLIYKHGQSSLESVKKDKITVSNCVLNVKLKNPDWKSTLWKELDLCSMNTEALYTPGSSTLLGDDINTTDTSVFSMEGDVDFDEEASDIVLPVPPLPAWSRSSTPSSGRNSPAASDDSSSDKPQRPERPPPRPTAPLAEKKVPPQRPGKPPPRPTSGPTKVKPEPAKPLKAPMRPQVEQTKFKQINNIGLPTNVQHQGHAISIDDAERLIDKLLLKENNTSQPSSIISPSDISIQLKSPSPQSNLSRSQTAECLTSDSSRDENFQGDIPKPKPRIARLRSASVESFTMTERSLAEGSQPPLPVTRTRPVTNVIESQVNSTLGSVPPVPSRNNPFTNKQPLVKPVTPCPSGPPPPLPSNSLTPNMIPSSAARPRPKPSSGAPPPPLPSRPPSSLPPVPARSKPPPPVPPRQ